VAAVTAAQPQETVGQDAALEERVELVPNELRQVGACSVHGVSDEGRGVLLHRVGELGTIGATQAVVNAVVDALDHAGLGRRAEQVQMPLTSEVVWRALRGEFPTPPGLPS
jgi:hypothetical protein